MADDPDPRLAWNGSNGGGAGWQHDRIRGTVEMPVLQAEFLEWLLSDPRDPQFQTAWAAQHGVDRRTCTRWKADPKFIAEWEEQARKKNISVDRVQSVVDSLHKAALSGDVKAASLYLQYIDKFTPRKAITIEGAETKGLSDEDLEAEVRQLLLEDQA